MVDWFYLKYTNFKSVRSGMKTLQSLIEKYGNRAKDNLDEMKLSFYCE